MPNTRTSAVGIIGDYKVGRIPKEFGAKHPKPVKHPKSGETKGRPTTVDNQFVY